ncbi:MAG: thiol reductant ABC exporter subunit CydD [Anaerolineales bacterium]|nr:thiol reductant ABC exporter subunit CydD [Anaerolineales bacterium]
MIDKRLLKEALASRLLLLLAILLGFAAAVLTVLQARLLSGVIGRVFLGGESLTAVWDLLWLLLGVIVLRALAVGGGDVAANLVGVRVKLDLREHLLAHLLDLGPVHARAERTGELTNTIIEGAEALEAYFGEYLPQLALAALIPLTILFSIFPLDVLSGVVLLVTAPLIPLFMVLIGRAAETLTQRQWKLLSRLSAHFLDVLQGLTTLKMLGQAKAQAKTIEQFSDHYARLTLSVLRVAFLSALVLEMLATISTAIVAVEIGLRLLYGRLDFEQALFILILAPEFYLPLRMLGTRFHAGMEGTAAAARIFAILDTPLPIQSEIASPTVPLLEAGIELVDVHYAYRDGERPSLNGVSFEIAAGGKVALVGASGAGKSTIANLLLGFLRPDTGQVLVDGHPQAELSMGAWRKQIAWVPQIPYLFNDTLAANIRLAKPEATQTEVEQAARQARLDEFVAGLPDGFQTQIGERGVRLSGGQVQRLALARAFLKDAAFMILDEPSANLDPELEAEIQEIIEHLLSGRTALVIAHRLNTVVSADQIVVLESGRVVECGRHAALIEQAGPYQRLVTAYGGGIE